MLINKYPHLSFLFISLLISSIFLNDLKGQNSKTFYLIVFDTSGSVDANSSVNIAKSDASRIAEVLQDSYGFDTKIISKNIKKESIIKSLSKHRFRNNDVVFLFFSGHGALNDLSSYRANIKNYITTQTNAGLVLEFDNRTTELLGNSNPSGITSIKNLSKPTYSGDFKQNLDLLFSRKGYITLGSGKLGRSYATKNGSLLVSAFIEALHETISDNASASWEKVLSKTTEDTKRLAKSYNVDQEPYFSIDLQLEIAGLEEDISLSMGGMTFYSLLVIFLLWVSKKVNLFNFLLKSKTDKRKIKSPKRVNSITEIRSYLKHGDTQKALTTFLRFVTESFPDYLDEVIHQSSIFKQLQKNTRNQLVSRENVLIEQNRISFALLEMLREIEAKT